MLMKIVVPMMTVATEPLDDSEGERRVRQKRQEGEEERKLCARVEEASRRGDLASTLATLTGTQLLSLPVGSITGMAQQLLWRELMKLAQARMSAKERDAFVNRHCGC